MANLVDVKVADEYETEDEQVIEQGDPITASNPDVLPPDAPVPDGKSIAPEPPRVKPPKLTAQERAKVPVLNNACRDFLRVIKARKGAKRIKGTFQIGELGKVAGRSRAFAETAELALYQPLAAGIFDPQAFVISGLMAGIYIGQNLKRSPRATRK
jgi:hypothetical protein